MKIALMAFNCLADRLALNVRGGVMIAVAESFEDELLGIEIIIDPRSGALHEGYFE